MRRGTASVAGEPTPRMRATLTIEGIECGFDALLSQSYDGALSCPQWNGVPVSVSVKPAE
jgi:hypothetical protein